MIRNIENLRRAMLLERQDPSIKAHFFGSGGQEVVVFRRHDQEIARGMGINAETAYRKAYENLTGASDKARTEVRSVEDAPSDEGPKATQDDSASPPKRRRGRPRKAVVTPSDDMESDVHV